MVIGVFFDKNDVFDTTQIFYRIFQFFLLCKKITISIFFDFLRFLRGVYNVCDFLLIFGHVDEVGSIKYHYF